MVALRILLTTLCCLILATDLSLNAGSTLAQNSAARVCELPFFRVAGQPGGATEKVTVVNIGQPCARRDFNALGVISSTPNSLGHSHMIDPRRQWTDNRAT